MPKRKEPPGESRTPVQPPEAGPKLERSESLGAHPIMDVAAATPSIPTVPRKGPTPAAPATAQQPAFRPPARGFDPSSFQKVRGNQLDAAIVLYPPAIGRVSTIGTGLIGECALANGLGTQEPVKVFVGFSEDNTLVFLMPVGSKATRGVDVTYHKGRAMISLWQAFDESKRVEEGYREYYGLWRTPEPVTIHETTGWAVYFSMEHREKEQASTRETTEAEAQPKAKKAKAKAKAPVEEAKTEAADEVDQEQWSEVYDEIIAEQDLKLKELEKRLKAYEDRFGKL